MKKFASCVQKQFLLELGNGYTRSKRLIMVTPAETQNNFLDAISALIELDYNAIKAYQTAIDRLNDEEYQEILQEFMEDHQRHIDNLSNYLIEQRRTPPSEPDLKSIFIQGKVVIASLTTDQAILRAMRSNEEDTNKAYERIISHPGKPDELSQVLNQGLSDERRHRDWFLEEIAAYEDDGKANER